MRVIAGAAKGRRLGSVRGGTVRPTTDRVREAVFSTLGPAVVGAAVLDLYAGTGALGIEALSRGAASAVFVDHDPSAAASIEANLALTGLAGKATVRRSTAEQFVAAPAGGTTAGGVFDLVLLDPPYGAYPGGFPAAVVAALCAGSLLAGGGEIVVEMRAGSPRDAADAVVPAGAEVLLDRRYGDTRVLFLRPVQAHAPELGRELARGTTP